MNGNSHHLDLCVVPVRTGEPPVAREQRNCQEFRQGHVGGVIGRQGVPQRENASGQLDAVVPLDSRIEEPLEPLRRALARDFPLPRKPPKTAQYLDVDQERRVKGAAHHPSRQSVAVLLQDQLEGTGGVENDQRLGRPRLMMVAVFSFVLTEESAVKRCIISSRVGRSASRFRIARA